MSPDQILYAALTVGSPASGIEAATGGRIYPVRVPLEKPVPAVAYKRVESQPEFALHSNVVSWQIVRYEIWCVANDHPTAESLGDLVEQMNADGIRVVDRISEKGEREDSPFAAILTVDVAVI